MDEFRIEIDSLGEVRVPANVYWGAQTQRAVNNFKISNYRFPPVFLKTLIQIKKAAAIANKELKNLDPKIADTIVKTCDLIIEKEMWDQFPLDIFQSGSGTQTNMNANEVISNLGNELLGYEKGKKNPIHPNDHVNRSQSSNDVIPTTLYLSTYLLSNENLIPAMDKMIIELERKEKEFWKIIKIGRTHLQDAVPISLGQEFSSYKTQLKQIFEEIKQYMPKLLEVPLGGTAVGTGLNTPNGFDVKVTGKLSELLGLEVKPSKNKFADISAHDKIVMFSSLLKNLATILIKIINDQRFYASGPRAGLSEIFIPANEPGSSIMPGKVNPTQAESIIQVCLKVIGNDLTISTAGFYASQFDLNTAKPLMAHNILESILLLSNSMNSYVDNCLSGIKPNFNRLKELIENSLMLVTALNPYLGYDEAARIAKKAYAENKTIKEVLLEEKMFSEKEIDEILNPEKLVFPHKQK